MHQPNDRSAKWLIEHHGDALLKLGGLPPVESWRAVANEEVAPRRTPDGVLEVKFADHPTECPVIIEVESRYSADNRRQMSEDLMLTRLTTGVWPDAILLTLTGPEHPAADDSLAMTSAGNTSGVAMNWRTIRLWELDADDLFALGDVGVIPLIPLARSTSPPAELLARCRAEIDRNAPADQRIELLIVSRLLASYRYNYPNLLDVFLEDRMYTDSPEFIRLRNKFQAEALAQGMAQGKAEGMAQGKAEGKAEALREVILDTLQDRFATVPVTIAEKLAKITDISFLKQLNRLASHSEDMPGFLAQSRLDS